MDQASVTVALSFFVAIGLFGLLTLFLIYDERPRPARVGPDTTAAGFEPPPPYMVGRFRLVVVVVTFLIWSLLISEHLRPRR